MAKRAGRGREVSSEPAEGLGRRTLLTIAAVVVLGLVILALFVWGGEGEGVPTDEQEGDALPVEVEGDEGAEAG